MANEKHTNLLRDYSADIERYLDNKLPDLPEATAQEISEYLNRNKPIKKEIS